MWNLSFKLWVTSRQVIRLICNQSEEAVNLLGRMENKNRKYQIYDVTVKILILVIAALNFALAWSTADWIYYIDIASECIALLFQLMIVGLLVNALSTIKEAAKIHNQAPETHTINLNLGGAGFVCLGFIAFFIA